MIWVEVRQRPILGESLFGPWVITQRAPEGVRGLTVTEVARGEAYEVQARRFDDATGRASDWAVLGTHTVQDPLERPSPPVGLRVECGAELVWEPATDLLAVSWEIRHAPDFYQNWDDMVAAPGGGVKSSPFPLCNLPKGLRTFAVRGISAAGVAGDPAFCTVQLPDYDEGLPVEVRRTEAAPAWPGTIEGGAVSGGVLEATPYSGTDSQPAGTDDRAPAWLDDDAGSAWPTLYQELRYTISYDPEALASGGYSLRRDGGYLTVLPVVLQGENWRVEYRLHDAPAWTDNDKDPAFPGASDTSFADHGVDDTSPAWGDPADPAWGPDDFAPDYDQYQWRPWPGKLASLHPQRIDFRIVIPAGPIRGRIGGFAIRETLPRRAGTEVPTLSPLGAVSQDPASASETPSAGALPRARADGTIDPGFLPPEAELWRAPISLTFGQFSAPGTSKALDVYDIAPGESVEILLEPTALWAGGLLTSVTVSIGIPGTADLFVAAFDLTAAPGGTNFAHVSGGTIVNMRDPTPLRVTVQGDAALTNLASGAMVLRIRSSKPLDE